MDSFENKMEELEKIVARLEDGSLSLDESLKLFERGVKLSADGMRLLDVSEDRVQKLTALAQRVPGVRIAAGDADVEEI